MEKEVSSVSNKEILEKAKANAAKKKQEKKIKSKITYIIIAVAIVILSLIIWGIVSIVNFFHFQSYEQYEAKMYVYGFNKMYTNGSAKTSESVSKAEALKMVIAAVLNKNDISGFAESSDEYPEAMWVEYAKGANIPTETVDKTNYNQRAKYIEVIEYFVNAKKKFLDIAVTTEVDTKLNDLNAYTAEQQNAIKDMIANDILSKELTSLNGKKNIFKGQLNQLVVNFVEKYNTIVLQGEKLNINPDKIPSNAKEYPYTLAGVEKEVYEKKIETVFEGENVSAKDLYAIKKDRYPQIKEYSEGYLNAVLNVDYKTIDATTFADTLSQYLLRKPTQESIDAYIKYVKENQIVIKGSAEAQMPAFYLDGLYYRMRMKLNFEIQSAKTKDNLLYLDFIGGDDNTYEKSSYTNLIVDYYMTTAMNSDIIFISETNLYTTIIDKESSGITAKVQEQQEGEGYVEEN